MTDQPVANANGNVDDLDGVERVGDILARRIGEHSWGQLRIPTTTDAIEQSPPDETSIHRAARPVADKVNGETNPCPHCAGERLRMWRPGPPEDRLQITTPEVAAEMLVPMLQGLDREHCVTLNLDTKHRLIAASTVSIGSIDHTFMSPREIYRDALLHGASAIVVAHNHPSGDAEPSRDDELVTRRLGQAGDIVGVEVLDHLVIGYDRWVSLGRRGVLTDRKQERRTTTRSKASTRTR